jgi:hypothetical protein
VSVSGQALVFVVRTQKWSVSTPAGLLTYAAFILAQVCAYVLLGSLDLFNWALSLYGSLNCTVFLTAVLLALYVHLEKPITYSIPLNSLNHPTPCRLALLRLQSLASMAIRILSASSLTASSANSQLAMIFSSSQQGLFLLQ